MKILIQLLIIASINTVSPTIENTVWEIYEVWKEVDNTNIKKTYAIDLLLNEQFKETIVSIGTETIEIKGEYFEVAANIVTITTETIIAQEDGKEVQIQYTLSENGKVCEFTLADGTTLKARKKG